MRKVLILGWGNPLRGDDGIGWRAAERLSGMFPQPEITVRVSHQLLPEFAEEISRSNLVIFVDARRDNSPSGSIVSSRIEPRHEQSTAFSHQLDPPALLGMARTLYGSCPEAHFITVAEREFECGEKLSAEVESALPRVLAHVQTLCGLESYLHSGLRKAT